MWGKMQNMICSSTWYTYTTYWYNSFLFCFAWGGRDVLGAIDPAEIGSVKLKEQVVCDKIPKVSVDRHRSRNHRNHQEDMVMWEKMAAKPTQAFTTSRELQYLSLLDVSPKYHKAEKWIPLSPFEHCLRILVFITTGTCSSNKGSVNSWSGDFSLPILLYLFGAMSC